MGLSKCIAVLVASPMTVVAIELMIGCAADFAFVFEDEFQAVLRCCSEFARYSVLLPLFGFFIVGSDDVALVDLADSF